MGIAHLSHILMYCDGNDCVTGELVALSYCILHTCNFASPFFRDRGLASQGPFVKVGSKVRCFKTLNHTSDKGMLWMVLTRKVFLHIVYRHGDKSL
jgi:hypothetical protein